MSLASHRPDSVSGRHLLQLAGRSAWPGKWFIVAFTLHVLGQAASGPSAMRPGAVAGLALRHVFDDVLSISRLNGHSDAWGGGGGGWIQRSISHGSQKHESTSRRFGLMSRENPGVPPPAWRLCLPAGPGARLLASGQSGIWRRKVPWDDRARRQKRQSGRLRRTQSWDDVEATGRRDGCSQTARPGSAEPARQCHHRQPVQARNRPSIASDGRLWRNPSDLKTIQMARYGDAST